MSQFYTQEIYQLQMILTILRKMSNGWKRISQILLNFKVISDATTFHLDYLAWVAETSFSFKHFISNWCRRETTYMSTMTNVLLKYSKSSLMKSNFLRLFVTAMVLTSGVRNGMNKMSFHFLVVHFQAHNKNVTSSFTRIFLWKPKCKVLS